MDGGEGDGVSQIVLEGVGAPAEAKLDDGGVDTCFVEKDACSDAKGVRSSSGDVFREGDVVGLARNRLQGPCDVVAIDNVSGRVGAVNCQNVVR